MEFKAYKMHGLGNNFLIIDRRNKPISLSKEKIIELGKRNNIGFDQLIFIDEDRNSSAEVLVIPITIYNSDGNEINACGNGSRCIAYFICKEKKVDRLLIETKERTLGAYLDVTNKHHVKINMGKALFAQYDEIPLANDNLDPMKLKIDFLEKDYGVGFCVNVGNPHIIFFVNDCLKVDIKKIGPMVESHHYFPEKINVTFAEKLDEKGNIKVNVWERGAGKTKACGTAACATAVAAHITGIKGIQGEVSFGYEKMGTNLFIGKEQAKKIERVIQKNVKIYNIHFEEGALKIENDVQRDELWMTGPVSDIEEINIKI